MSVLSQKHLQVEEDAYAWVEARVWPDGPVCPHCESTERITKMKGKAHRIGLYKCYACRKQFTLKIGTIFEKSHVKMHIWLQAFYLICGSKKGISSHQLHRTLGLSLKTAWFLSMRVREAMRSGALAPPMGGEGEVVEVDETFIGQKKGRRRKSGRGHKHAVLSLVQRGGCVRSFHVADTSTKTIGTIVRDNIDSESAVMTDDAQYYNTLDVGFASRDSVNHSKDEYVREEEGRPLIHTNTVEGYFSVFKRRMRGTYQHCSEKHLHRYLAEFDFRHNHRIGLGVNDEQRTEKAITGVVGRRLTYRTTNEITQ